MLTLLNVLVRVTIVVIKHHDQSNWEMKGLIWLLLRRKSGQELKQGRNLEAGADAETMEGAAYWLVPMACSAYILIEPRTASPGMAQCTMGWALPHQSLIKRMPAGLPTA